MSGAAAIAVGENPSGFTTGAAASAIEPSGCRGHLEHDELAAGRSRHVGESDHDPGLAWRRRGHRRASRPAGPPATAATASGEDLGPGARPRRRGPGWRPRRSRSVPSSQVPTTWNRGLGSGHDEQVGQAVLERVRREEGRALRAWGRRAPRTGWGRPRASRRPGRRAAARCRGRRRRRAAARVRPRAIRDSCPTKGATATGPAKPGRDDWAAARAGRREQVQARQDEDDPLHGPLPMRFTSATWLG